jgi:hypothetical protein
MAIIFGLIAAFGLWAHFSEQAEIAAHNQRETDYEKQDMTDEARSIAWRYALKAGLEHEERNRFGEQGAEVYRYYRRQGANNREAIAEVERAYADLYDRAERKAIASMTKPSSKRRQ